jgi:hypothetical protein
MGELAQLSSFLKALSLASISCVDVTHTHNAHTQSKAPLPLAISALLPSTGHLQCPSYTGASALVRHHIAQRALLQPDLWSQSPRAVHVSTGYHPRCKPNTAKSAIVVVFALVPPPLCGAVLGHISMDSVFYANSERGFTDPLLREPVPELLELHYSIRGIRPLHLSQSSLRLRAHMADVSAGIAR